MSTDISIVIPAFNEAEKIRTDVQLAGQFISQIGYRGEIIVADDGSEDDTAQAASSTSTPQGVFCNCIRYEPHRGKGYALRRGIAVSSGQIVMFVDSGNCVPLSDALTGIEWPRSGVCEIAHGSRRLRETQILRSKSLYRKLCSRLFRWVIYGRIQLPVALTDTQCGFKVYHGDVARQLYGECELDGFLIDIEVIIRAWQQGYRIREFPIHWKNDPDSRTRPLKHIKTIWKETKYIQKLLEQARTS